ncbi:MAG: histidinol-phosphatase HisJ family protein [Bacilli bacterium]
MYKSDYHIHTNFSFDSNQDLKQLIEEAISLNINEICITDHYDFNYPHGDDFTLDINKYIETIESFKQQYIAQISIKIGIEIGLDLNYQEEINNILKTYQFDYIIGSIHVINNEDFYYKDYFHNKTQQQAYQIYLEETLACLQAFPLISCLGHLDNINKYIPENYTKLLYQDYSSLIDSILKEIINTNRGLEINTSGLPLFNEPYPSYSILTRYINLGGNLITIGSDSHTKMNIGSGFNDVVSFLKSQNINYYHTYTKMIPIKNNV